MLLFSKRTRKIGNRYGSLSGQLKSNKNDSDVQFESSLERDFIYLLEFDDTVSEFLEQPFSFTYMDLEGKKRKYTPDFMISYEGNKPSEIVEIKYYDEYLRDLDKHKYKYEIAKKQSASNNMIFRVVTEKEIRFSRANELFNAHFLSRYRDYMNILEIRHNIMYDDKKLCYQITTTLEQIGRSNIQFLIDEVCSRNKEQSRAEIIFLTWYLIANSWLIRDHKERLSMELEVWR